MLWLSILTLTHKLRAIVLGCLMLALFSCAAAPKTQTEEQTQVTYDMHSWRDIIPSGCARYFDGCNNCMRSDAQSIAACTRKACFEYSMPRCLDAPPVETTTDYKKVIYQCDDDVVLSVFYGEYRSDDLRIKLTPEQIYLSDGGTDTAHLLSRERSASGEKYRSKEITFHAKGQSATVLKDGKVSYQNCTLTL